jgi:hypothetical protein
MANKKITDLVDIGTPESGDLLEIVDISEGVSKRVAVGNLGGGGGPTPSLQEVTDVGNYTDNEILLDGLEGSAIVFTDGNPSSGGEAMSKIQADANTLQFRNVATTEGFTIQVPLSGSSALLTPETVTTETIATEEWVTDNFSGGGASLIREDFTFGLSQTFTLANDYGQVYSVEVQGQGALSPSQYTLVSPNQVTINDTLNTGDYIVIIYSNAITGVQPYYSQAETDALVESVAILKSVGPTYTTNAILTVTQAEYDALTPDPTTLYVIL